MDNSGSLNEIVRKAFFMLNDVEDWNAEGFFLEDPLQQVYSILIIPSAKHPAYGRPFVSLLARVVDGIVIIEYDQSDRPLVDMLVEMGISSEKVICRYAGETLPQPAI